MSYYTINNIYIYILVDGRWQGSSYNNGKLNASIVSYLDGDVPLPALKKQNPGIPKIGHSMSRLANIPQPVDFR